MPNDDLPPLPESEYWLAFYDEGGMQEASGEGYTADQMRDYARAAVAAERKQWRKAEGYALVVHPENDALLRALPEGQWVILQRRVLPWSPTPGVQR